MSAMAVRRGANVLFLGGAKRVSMARMFSEAALRLGLPEPRLYSYEMETHVPIASVATVVVGLRWRDPAVCRDILDLCRRESIGVVVPFVDGAVAVAADVAALSAGEVFAPTGDVARAEQMFDKVLAADLFERAHLSIPQTWQPGMPCIGLIAKPRHGSASKGIVAIDSAADMEALGNTDYYLIQERIDRRREYTVDCYVSVDRGRLSCVSPRLRVEVSGGEVSRTVTVDRPDVIDLAAEALRRLDLRGAVTVQVLEDLDTGTLMLMEINPRLGGGAVCTVHAGGDIPAMIMAEAASLPIPEATPVAGVEIVRYPQEVVFRP